MGRDCASCTQTNDCGIWPGNETSCAHAYKIGKWHPSQQTTTTECCEWLLLTRANFKLSRRWVVIELRVVIRISFVLKWWWVLKTVFEISLLNIMVLTKKKNMKNGTFATCTLLRLAVFCVAFGHLYESCWSQSHSKRKPGCLNKLLVHLWWSYTAFA